MSNRIIVVIIIIIIINFFFWVKLLWLLSSLAMMEPTTETIFPRTFPSIYLWVMLMSALWNTP